MYLYRVVYGVGLGVDGRGRATEEEVREATGTAERWREMQSNPIKLPLADTPWQAAIRSFEGMAAGGEGG